MTIGGANTTMRIFLSRKSCLNSFLRKLSTVFFRIAFIIALIPAAAA